MVSESLFRLFHAEMKRIAREWHGGLTIADVALRPVAANTVVERMRLESTGAFEAVAIAVESAKADLRAMVRAQAPHSPGPYLVPV